ncbi:MAG: hypothetical protein M1832_004475 [Thelocarpon impressellum]|nr:MAG: hypothetical protein M1832_004475 [Thelocarpon impressellum]
MPPDDDVQQGQDRLDASSTSHLASLDPRGSVDRTGLDAAGEARPPSRVAEAPSTWAWVPLPVRRVTSATAGWIQGPRPPQRQTIRPLFPRAQTAPLRLLRKHLPKRRHRLVLLLAFYFCWLLAFVTVVHHSAFAGHIEGYGRPTPIACGASYWARGNGCGLDGNACRPFENSSFAFRCPGSCLKQQVLNTRAVGAQEIIYRPLVVGGPADERPGVAHGAVYRGDSFLCSAAIHAGVVRDQDGGCAVARLVGERDRYPSTLRNGIRSVAFDSTFPLSFVFVRGSASACRDLRWPLLAVSLLFTVLLALFTTSPAVFFFSVFVGLYFHVGLGSDPPSASADYYTILSLLLGRFLPAAFVAFVLHRYCVRRTLAGLEAQVEKAVLWLGGCWVGALTNYTFDFIPIQRLTPHDLAQQPGARAALAIIILLILAIALGQIYYLRREGRLPRMLALYATFGATLGLFAAIPRLSLRIHHYILALLLLPGTSLQTRPSLLYQGILLGFFINGIARWGFDSILQTPRALLGDGKYESPLPQIAAPEMAPGNITFRWPAPSLAWSGFNDSSFDGVSVLVNDVERHVAYDGYAAPQYTFRRRPEAPQRPYYFRFAYLRGTDAADYTKAGIWEADGSWTNMEQGPSR